MSHWRLGKGAGHLLVATLGQGANHNIYICVYIYMYVYILGSIIPNHQPTGVLNTAQLEVSKVTVGIPSRHGVPLLTITGWWLTYPSEKC